MHLGKGLHVTLLLLIFLYGCSSAVVPFMDSGVQKKDIKKAVEGYSSENWESRRDSVRKMSDYSTSVYAKNVLIFLILATEDSHPLIRIDAASALKEIKSPSAMKRLQELAENDPAANVRWTAVKALADYENRENADIFIKGITENDWLLREASVIGLLKIDDPAIQKEHISYIKKALKDKNTAVRIAALSNLKIRNTDLYTIISDIINDKESGLSLKKAALQAVKGYIFDEKTRKTIKSLLTHWDRKIRILALRALKEELIIRKF